MEDSGKFISEREVIRWLLFSGDELLYSYQPAPRGPAGELFSALMRKDVVELMKSTSIDAHYLLNEHHHFDVVTHLINCHNFDPQYQDSDGNNLLHIACILFVKESLLKWPIGLPPSLGKHHEAGSRLKVALTPRRGGVRPGDEARIAYIHEVGSRLKEIIEYAIEKCHCDPQIKNSQGALPLHIACCSELVPLEVVQLLSKCDVNTGLSSEWDFDWSMKLVPGDTPLHIACLRNSIEIVKYLTEECHCDPQIQNCQGVLPLHIACSSGSLEIVKLVSHCNTNTTITSTCTWISGHIEDPTVHVVEGDTPLHIACRYKEDVIVKYLIKECHCDPQIKNCKGALPLHIACCSELVPLEVVQLLSKCDVNTGLSSSWEFDSCNLDTVFSMEWYFRNWSMKLVPGDTPLHIACLSNSIQTVMFLTEECHCDPQIQNCQGVLPLHIACSSGSLEIVKLVSHCNTNTTITSTFTWISGDIEDPTVHVVEGDTPLHIACRYKEDVIVKYLIEQCHCDPQIQNCQGVLPLHIACSSGSLEMVKLVSHCNTNTTITNTRTWILRGTWPKLTVHVLEGNTPLHIACRYKEDVIVKYLIEQCHCDPQIQNCQGVLPLHIACSSGSLEMVKLVSHCNTNTTITSTCTWISRDIEDPTVHVVEGDTPLHIACRYKEDVIVKYLIEQCHCDPQIQNCQGVLPLHIACSNGSLEMVKLVSHCNTNTTITSTCTWISRDKKEPTVHVVEGDTPLHIACRYEEDVIVKYLIEECHCDPQIKNCQGALALHIACAVGSLNTVRLVSNCNVNTGLSNEWDFRNLNLKLVPGDTPLHIACLNNSIEIVKYLTEECHCDPQIQNCQGVLPPHIAFEKKSPLMMKLVRWHPHNRDIVAVGYLKEGKHVVCYQVLRWIASYLRDNQDEDGNTILHIACRPCVDVSRSLLVVKCLIEEKYCSPCVLNNEGELPLHVACSQKALEIVKLVSNCDVSSKTKTTGDSPLHIACKYSTVGVVKYLFKQHRCDLTAVNNSDETCLETAVMYGQLDIVKYLIDIMDLQHTYMRKLLYCAFVHERVEIIKCIVEVGLVDQSHQEVRGESIMNIPNDNGELAIHVACQQSSLDVVELISNYTYDINATTQKSGDTPLHIACRKQTTRFVKYLIEKKQCNPNILNDNGELPLHIACREQANEIVKIVSDCDIDFPTKLGNTPLHEACGTSKAFSFPNKSMEIIGHLVSRKKCKVNVRNNEGKTAIHYACKAQSVELVNYLLFDGKADLSLTDNEGQTPLMFATNPALIKVLLHHGADPRPLYKSFAQYFRDHSSENPPPTPQKILVVGNAGAGKTSLIQSLESEGEKSKEQCEPQPTAGIIPSNFQSDIYGPVIWYDFAGQREYYASHEAILHNLIAFSPPVVLLVVDISKKEAHVRHDLLYWLSFIEAQCTSTRNKPHLIVIGSHADIIKKQGIDSNSWKLRQVIGNVKLVGEISMDCRESKSSAINKLQKCLKSSSSQLQRDTVVGFTCHCFYIFLLDRFDSKPAITVQQIIDAIDEAATTDELDYVFDSGSASSLSSDDNELSSDLDYQVSDIIHLLPEKSETIQFCEDLNDRGHIILVKDPHQYEHSWVILNKEEILSGVNGTVFAPLEFMEHRMLASSTGVVPFSKLVTHFPNFNPNMLIGFLSQLEFCREIEDRQILKFIYRENATKSNDLERYLFFPSLVSVTRPEGVWRLNECFNYKCGFILHCSETDKFFTPRFLQVLILRLAFSFALIPCMCSFTPAIERCCRVWKNGISWINENGIESVIEVLEDFQAVVVMLRCITGEENEVKCMFHRSSVIQAVLNTRADICPQVRTTEFLIHPSGVEYPLKLNEGITLFSLAAVARAVASAKPCVVSDCGRSKDLEFLKVEDLLCFEPYSDSGTEVLKEIFNDDNCNKEISDDFIYRITDSIVYQAQEIRKKKWLMNMLKVPLIQLQEHTSRVPEGPTRELIGLFQTWRQCTAGIYQCLRETFDKFSVFCGRNPLVS